MDLVLILNRVYQRWVNLNLLIQLVPEEHLNLIPLFPEGTTTQLLFAQIMGSQQGHPMYHILAPRTKS